MSKKAFITIGVAAAIIIAALVFIVIPHKSVPYELATVQTKAVTERISASGKVEPPVKIDLHFKNSGYLKSRTVKTGDTVTAGQLLAAQDTALLDAQVQETQSSIAFQQAKLDQLIAGASHEEIALSEVALQSAQRNYEAVQQTQEDLVQAAYIKLLNSTPEARPVDDTSDDEPPVISGTYTLGKEGTIFVSSYYSAGGISFRVSGLTTGSGSGNAVIPEPLGDSGLSITFPSSTKIETEDWAIEIPNKRGASYLTNQTAYETALQTQKSALSAAQSLVDQKQAELALKKAGVRSSDRAVYQAQISQAEASLEKILAQRDELMLFAPSDGLVADVFGEIGEIVRPEQPVVSLASKDALQIRLNVVEDGIVNVRVGQNADILFDAIKDETFRGTVVSVNPAETIIGGAVYYETIVALNTPDERLRSGMTATVWIETAQSEHALVVPLSAVQTKKGKSNVQVFTDGAVVQKEVVTGLRDGNGQIEIVSGLSEGEQVIVAKIK
jgi:HlyD family secretion protein